ncbi:MAG TPA: hypothetical protein VHF89_03620 [Solirubrobacteraceae bacterium]|nr:hypothetical protein [Solirubrobacteraceae bacterium]
MIRALLLTLALLAVAPASASAVVIGIADQKPDLFDDRRFLRLGIKHARISVPWDAMRYPWQVEELDLWMNGARARGVHPLVSFNTSRIASLRHVLPSPDELAHEFRIFRARYPWVWNFATWNEANVCAQSTCRRERLVAAYYHRLKIECPRCRVLAAEVLDMPNMVKWVRRFRRAYRRYGLGEPRLWGLHNYVEANRFKTGSVELLLRSTKGSVWVTEVGGIVKRRKVRGRRHSGVEGIPESKAHAARVTRFLLRKVLPRYRRVTRMYLYQWNSSTRRDTWDSAFIGPDDRPRPALRVLRRELERRR